MIKNTNFLFIALAGLMISSCAPEADSTVEVDVEEKKETCLYSYSAENSEVKFTAYKFLGKTGVGGTFTEVNVTGGDENESALDLIENLSFEIPISSISTNDESRDEKIQRSFFGHLNVSKLTGEVVKLDEDSKKATVLISFNDISKEVEGDYVLDNLDFVFKAEINVNNWEAQEGIKTLNDECHDLHIDYANGDTESKLWPDVSISFGTQLTKNCE